MKDVLNQTKTSFICVGTAYEVSLEEKLNSKDEECIMGSIVLRVPGGTQRFRVYSNKFNKSGKNAGKLNYLYNALVSAYKWNTEINGNGGEPTRVMLRGEFDINDYAPAPRSARCGASPGSWPGCFPLPAAASTLPGPRPGRRSFPSVKQIWWCSERR